MVSRLINALLWYLPGNLYQSPDNPLQRDRLPNISGVELDYPVYQDSPAVGAQHLFLILSLTLVLAPVLTWTHELGSLLSIFLAARSLALMFVGAMLVLAIVGRWSHPAAYVLAAASLPLWLTLDGVLQFSLAAVLLAVVAQTLFANSLVTSYLYWKTAAPTPRALSAQIRDTWRQRFWSLSAPLRGSELFAFGHIPLIFAVACLLPAIQGNGPLPATDSAGARLQAAFIFCLVAMISLVWTVLHELIGASLYGRPNFGPLAGGQALLRALVVWCTYNRRGAQGAGVHQDPSGSCIMRRILLVGVIAIWGCVWAGLGDTRAKGTANAESRLASLVRRATGDVASANDHGPSKTKSKIRELEPYELEFAARLPPGEREKYLSEYAALDVQRSMEIEAAAERSAENGSPARTLLTIVVAFGSLLLAVLIPGLCVLATSGGLLYAMTARSLVGIEACVGNHSSQRVYTPENWENLVARIRGSQDDWEKDSVLMGVNARDDMPVLIPRKVFGEHVHILGDSGSGKTSLGLAPLITQLMRFEDTSVIVIDLKADDHYLLETLRFEAAALDARLKEKDSAHPGFPFRWFTTAMDRSSYVINPLTQRVMTKLAPFQRADILVSALGLHYGTDYGRKYFGDANYELLHFVLRENPNVQSFAELAQILAGAAAFPLSSEIKKSAGNVQSSINRLAYCAPLNACPHQHTPAEPLNQAIDFDQFFEVPQALYVALSASVGVTFTAEIARIFLYSLLSAAQNHGLPRKRVVLVVDEFQRLLSKNVELFLQQARSADIGCILINQSLSDLESVDANLIPAIKTNTRFRQIFGAGHRDDIRDIIDSAGETVYASRGWNYLAGWLRPELQSVTVNETRGTRITINDVLLATDIMGRNIASVRRGEGYAQFGGFPFLMDSVHHISQFDYDKRRKKEWPGQIEGTLVAKLADYLGASPLPPNILGNLKPESSQNQPIRRQVTVPGSTDSENSSTPLPPDQPSPDDSEGLIDDPLTIIFQQQQAEQAARSRKKKKSANRGKST